MNEVIHEVLKLGLFTSKHQVPLNELENCYSSQALRKQDFKKRVGLCFY